MTAADERFMRRALELAARGCGAVEPNPPVGAVIVRDDEAIAEGWHERFGGPHAEAAALAAARQAGADPAGATMYVTLEPCTPFPGKKTPSCAEAVAAAGIARVVVAMEDPYTAVAGRGLRRLREAGIEVVVGVCEGEARSLLAPYIKLTTKGRPWVVCKWAQTADGYLALPPGQERWISGDDARVYVQELRGLCDGILVGIETVLADNPLLTNRSVVSLESNRSGRGRQPTRVVLDSGLRLPPDCRLVRTAREVPVIVATTETAGAAKAHAGADLADQGVELLALPTSADGLDLGALLDELGERRWTRLLVEGGAKVLRSFIHGSFADELLAFVSERSVGEGAGALPRFDIAAVRQELALGEPDETRRFASDELCRFLLRRKR